MNTMNLQTFVKMNFLSGLFGTLVLAPLAFVYELIDPSSNAPVFKFEPIDLVTNLLTLLVAPLFFAIVFSITALAAYPVVNWLQRKGFVSLPVSRPSPQKPIT
jgi:hypothetical protein